MTSGIQVSHAYRRYLVSKGQLGQLPHNFLVRAAVSNEGVLSLQITTIMPVCPWRWGAPRGQAQGLNEHAQGLASVKPAGGGVEEVWAKCTGVDRSHRISKQAGSGQTEGWRNTDQGLTQVMMGVSTRDPRQGPPCPHMSHTSTS